MTGIYLIVWDETQKERSPLLRSTKGGYPHLTLAHTGKEISAESLKNVAAQILFEWSLKPIIFQRAEVNSFEDRPGHTRHDVLLIADDATKSAIEESRDLYLRASFANHDRFTMRIPHVTYGIYEERGEAERVARELNEIYLIQGGGGYGVVVTGVTID